MFAVDQTLPILQLYTCQVASEQQCDGYGYGHEPHAGVQLIMSCVLESAEQKLSNAPSGGVTGASVGERQSSTLGEQIPPEHNGTAQ